MIRSDDGVLTGTKVLVVEDMADSREAFARLLALEGADVLAVSNASEALEIARTHDIDVLMSDLGLPDMPGDVLISAVLAESKRRPKIVVVTGYGEPHVSRARRAGADLVMMKPVAWNRLVDFIAASTPAAA
jgi:two-component system, chemotaxis family, CheB/CheR fusion protein